MITKSTLRRIIKIIFIYKKELSLTLVVTLIISVVNVVNSSLLSYLIDNVIYSKAKLTLITISMFLVLVSFFQIALSGLKRVYMQQISYKMDIDLLENFFSKILTIKYPFFESHKTGELLSRLNDTRMVRDALSNGFLSLIANTIIFIVIGIALIKINIVLFLIQLISVIFLAGISILYGKYYAKEYPKSMESYADLQSLITESFSGIESLKTYPAKKTFKDLFSKYLLKNIKITWSIGEQNILQGAFCGIIEKITSVLILIVGCFFVMNEKMSLGQIISFVSLSGFFSNSFGVLIDLQAGIQEAFAGINRLFEIFDESSEEEENTSECLVTIPDICFNHLDFSYKKDSVLYKDFSLVIKAGEWISFVGKTGCGKTTLVKLLLKLYEPQKGNITFNSIDIKNINTDELRQKIAYIPQETVIFSGSIYDNITLFDELIDKNKVYDICKQIGIYEKIITLDNGFDTIVGERGFTLSGGEKQKISLCRAIIKNPYIVILDEATSNLDTESERLVVDVIKNLKERGITIISIAHRLSTVKKCDKIFVLDKCNIVEEGTYNNLKMKDGIFSKLLINQET